LRFFFPCVFRLQAQQHRFPRLAPPPSPGLPPSLFPSPLPGFFLFPLAQAPLQLSLWPLPDFLNTPYPLQFIFFFPSTCLPIFTVAPLPVPPPFPTSLTLFSFHFHCPCPRTPSPTDRPPTGSFPLSRSFSEVFFYVFPPLRSFLCSRHLFILTSHPFLFFFFWSPIPPSLGPFAVPILVP